MFTRPRRWLVGWNVIVLGLILVILGAAVYISLSRSLYTAVDLNLERRADEMATNLRELNEGELRVGPEGYRGGLFYLLINGDGQIIADPQGVSLGAAIPPFSPNSTPSYETTLIDGEQTRLYIRPVSVKPLPQGILVVGQSLSPQQDVLRGVLLILLAGGGFGLLLSLAGAWFLADRALVPIKQAFARQQEFVADASHELRTPLTILRSTVDLLNQHRAEALDANGELFDDLRHEITRMERLTTDLLTLARQDLNQLDLAVGEVDLAALATDIVRRMTPVAQAQGIALVSHSDGTPHIVEVDPDRIQQVMLILLDNALKHTPRGGSVTVTVKDHGSSVILTLADTGEGIPSEHLSRVFDRFYRADRSRSWVQGGAGLGLAIAKQLVEAHDGQLTLSSTLGAGTVATIRLRSSDTAPSLADRVGRFAAHVTRRPVR